MSSTTGFAINGRFLTQRVTGVQRYARNVVAAIDAALVERGQAAAIIGPRRVDDPGFQALPLTRTGRLSGHGWEQLELPISFSGPLLNLCNTAPLAKGEQIICIHDANVFTAPGSYGRAFRELYTRLQPLLVRRAARIATVSQASARQLARYLPIRADEIAVLPNGHEHALAWRPERAETAPLLLADRAGRRFVLALGSRARHKNLKLLIDIAPQLADNDIDVLIAGGEGDIFAPEALRAAPNVHLLGRLLDDDLAYLMDRALCLAFPSLTEGFGLPIVEAMARGCPVVSSDCASMPEVCGDAALLAAPTQPEAWISSIMTLARSPGLREELSGKGREQVASFSWAQTGAGYLDLLRQPAASLAGRAANLSRPPHIAVVIATRGRPDVVSRTVRHLLAQQSLKPTDVIVSCCSREDAGDLVGTSDATVVTGPAGLAAQRNTALARLPPGTEIVVFFDDDFVAHRDWLARAAEAFRDDVDVAALTGRVLADGATGPGIGFEEASRLVEHVPRSDWSWIDSYSPYGCNMAFRVSQLGDLRFDERLVLYGWLEDRDFGAALARKGGRVAKSAELVGVHMGVKSGRIAGDRLGYSQVVNPLYMLRKGTMTLPQVAGQLFRNMASNIGKAAWPEPFIDRRGRLRGNVLAIADVLRGHVQPERAASITLGSERA